ncbi:hypothetical protein A9798_08930 [Edwardsiella hoshinae]|uniref:Fimbrial protein n=2 Tax=Edwardsiella hoshinae TaxID=93378 RepID=A0ABN4T0T8_9GAMM|nr:hypothetical protein A9798_08930 [Edwardsiella hoshinae]
MKKTMIALGIAISAVSGVAHAWTNGEFSGAVDIGGTVTPPPVSPWQWKMGAPITGMDTSWDRLSASNKVTFNMTTPKPLLMGKLETPTIGGPGLAPQVMWQDAKGQNININFSATNNESSGSFSVPVMDGAGTSELGTAVLKIHSYGLMAKANTADNVGVNYQPLRGGVAGDVGFGMIPSQYNGIKQEANATLAAINSLAGEEIFTEAMKQGATVKNQAASATFTSPLSKNTAALVAGFESGDSIVVTFAQRPTSTTKWKIPLSATVTHQ